MKTISSKPSLTGQEFELDELLATNKSLAQQKRELHRQKLRQYSQKAVKLKEILKSSMDGSERKCLQGKLRSLQQKQDAQITKLAKIDQIQKQIDHYMTEEDEEESNVNKFKNIKKSQENSFKQERILCSVNQNTPAKKLSQRNSIPLQQINQSEEANSLQRSTKSNFLCKSSAFTGKDQYSDKKAAALHDSNDLRFKINDMQDKRYNNAKQFRAFSCWEPAKTSFQRLKPTKPKCNQVTSYEGEQRYENNKQIKFNKDFYLREQQQKLSTVMLSRKQSEARLGELENRVSGLVEKERALMKRIDNYEHQQSNLAKKCSHFIHSINRSRDIILSSGLILQQLSQMQINNRQLKSSHQFSIDSLESHATSEGPQGLSMELASFEKMLQQFLLCAQREVMLTSGELQQCGLKANRIREECSIFEAKKRTLQGQLLKLEQNIPIKRKEHALLGEQSNQLKQQNQQFDHFNGIKKKLVAQLEQKCDKLKVKKKVLSQKVEKIQGQLKIKQQQYASLLQIFKQTGSKFDQLQYQQRQLEEMMIFTERQIQKIKDLKSVEEVELQRYQSKLSQVKNAHEKTLLQIGQNQKRLVEIQSQLTTYASQQNNLHDRIRKLERQLNQSTNILDDQRAIITNQNDQINTKSNELLEWQKKIIAVADSHRALEAENVKLSQSIRKYKQEIEELKTQKQDTFSAKVELEEILSQVITKKQALLSEVDIRSGQLQTLLSDLMQGHEQLKSTSYNYEQIEQDLKKHHQQYESITGRLQEVKEELQEKMDEEANIIARINKLKLVQRQILLEIGLKGTSNKLDEELKSKISEAISELEIVNKLKGELKECKYQNRKLRLDNQRLSKIVSTQHDSLQHI